MGGSERIEVKWGQGKEAHKGNLPLLVGQLVSNCIVPLVGIAL